MTDEIADVDQPLKGLKRTKKKSLIGIDPLAWLNEDESDKEEVSIDLGEKVAKSEIVEKESEELSDEFNETETNDQDIMEEEVIEMEVEQSENNSGDCFKLESSISIADVSTLHEQLKIYLDQKNELEIDCSEVESVDAAALQLFIAFLYEAEKQNKKVIWKEPSDLLRATIKMMGLNNDFKI